MNQRSSAALILRVFAPVLLVLQDPGVMAGERPACLQQAEKQYGMVDFEGALRTLTTCLEQEKAEAGDASLERSYPASPRFPP